MTDKVFKKVMPDEYMCKTSARVDLFYKASRGIDQDSIKDLLFESWIENKLDTLKIIAYTRDIRGGKGERCISRCMLNWLATLYPDYLKANLYNYVCTYGRFDDVIAVFGTCLEEYGIELWANKLKEDMKKTINEPVSLVAKWIPSENKALDKKYNVVSKLCKVLKISKKELRVNYLTPLRKRIDLLESKMCLKKWEDIDFETVSSVAMKIHGRPEMAFERNQRERFEKYKQDLKSGRAKVNGKILFPNDVVGEYLEASHKDELLEAQWRALFEKSREFGNLSNCLVVLPSPNTALGILISSATTNEWRDLVLTIGSKPQFCTLQKESLYSKIQNLSIFPKNKDIDFDLVKTLDLILDIAIKNKFSIEKMPKKLIVASDTQVEINRKEYQSLVDRYNKNGYSVPFIVFWNVNGNGNIVKNSEINLSFVSGYSANVLKSIIHCQELPEQTSYTIMRSAIDDTRYDKIVLPFTV